MPLSPDSSDGDAPVAIDPPSGGGVGRVDHIDGALVAGWVFGADGRTTPAIVDFHVGDRAVGSVVARAADGGFQLQLDLTGLTGTISVTACLRDTGAVLEGSPIAMDLRAPLVPAHTARFVIVKPLPAGPGELALFVTHSPSGTIKPHVRAHVRALSAEGIATLLIVAADRPVEIDPALLDLVAGAIVRENRGYDFACWSHALHITPEAHAATTLYLVNDSIFGPVDQTRFAAMIGRVRASEAGMVGLTASQAHGWHAQSYFLALKPPLLADPRLHGFFAGVTMQGGKDDVIRSCETVLSAFVEELGYRVDILFPSLSARNPALFGWRELLEAGFPYVKLLLLRGVFPTIDLRGWRETLAGCGFDMALLDRTLATCTEGLAPLPGAPLLARPHRPSAPVRPYRIAFFGPWNYDNGLGAASRGLIAALRRCDVRLNLYPVEKPFHVHRALAPPVAIADFAGPADIAIVHLNPDSWHLLTDEQRVLIAQAGKRIGHWVWEMGHIPPAWRHNYASVDRIWAPSGFCAGLFAREGAAPVEVIPYTVPLPATIPGEDVIRALRERLELRPGERTILYAFDGASYLIRKNPAALVRAFACSGLADGGWRLLLKTKHLLDRPAEGQALMALAAATPGVRLVDAAFSAGEMAALIALADIYASPHCSEGFGLTIAEAMAAGKPVIATDFGGSTQFLDAACGYPVPADPWTLDEDFGHYTKGGTWARIDEPALADTLRAAACAVEAGDTVVGDAARRRVGETLSFDAVAARIEASLEALLADDYREDAPAPLILSNLSLGICFGSARLGERLHAVPLAPDLTPPSPDLHALPGGADDWLVFAPENAWVHPLFGRIVRARIAERPDADILFADDVALGEASFARQLRLKPGFDRTMLAAKDCIGPPLIVRAAAFRDLGGFDDRAGPAAMDDLLFRADAAGLSIAPLHDVLLAWKGPRPVVLREARRAMLARLPALVGHEIRDGLLPDTLEVRRRFTADTAPCVTLVIPTRRSTLPDGSGTYVERLLDRVALTDWPMERLRVLVGDDIAADPAWSPSRWPFRLDWLETPRAPDEPFNYAAKMNRLWRVAETDHLVLLNDDVLPTRPDWLRALMTHAVEEDVGGVGARLLYENGRIQHAGMAPLFDTAVHPWQNRRADATTYQDWAMVPRACSMVTGAVFATRRSLLKWIGGFVERFSLEYNDVDLCLRLRVLGYRILCTPHAEMVHAEKASRGDTPVPGQDLALFLTRWGDWLREDPAYHPRLRRNRPNIEPVDDPVAWYR